MDDPLTAGSQENDHKCQQDYFEFHRKAPLVIGSSDPLMVNFLGSAGKLLIVYIAHNATLRL